MDDDQRPFRRPFGERSEEERRLPFGARPPRLRPSEPPPREPDAPPFLTPPPPIEPYLGDLPNTPDDLEIISTRPGLSILDEPDTVGVDEEEAVEGASLDAVAEDALFPESGTLPSISLEEEEEDAVQLDAETTLAAQPTLFLDGLRVQSAPISEAVRTALQPTSTVGPVLRALGLLLLTAFVLATLFTWWTPAAFLPADSAQELAIALATQSNVMLGETPQPQGANEVPDPASPATSTAPSLPPAESLLGSNTIGIVSGHRGIHPQSGLPDPGAVCADGLTEQSVNEAVATQVVELLRGAGYQVDLLDEFDARLEGYRALALVSIHADTCQYINELATGFKVASLVAAQSATAEQDRRLVECLIDRYSATTGLSFHPSVTYDMTEYHNFYEIAPETPGAIIEIGFLYLDRTFLTQHTDVVALGVARGILCYTRNEPITP